MFKLDRRTLIAAWVAGAFALGSAAFAQEVNVEDLLTPGQLGEKSLGPADAPVSVVEYASTSCPHCAHFDTTTFDDFRLKYIDSGKVRYIFREFPLNAPAYAVAMLARCAPADRYFDVVHAFFRSQDQWLSGGDLKANILAKAKDFGFTEQTFDACLANQALFTAINEVRDRGSAFGVQATPTFFINGRKYEGALTLEDLDKAIEPLL
jgi:protein-disulfide isomerase